MPTPGEAILLRIIVGDNDRLLGRPLYNALVRKALAMKMAGATVLNAPVGFGRSRTIHTGLNVDAGPHLPIVIEIVDTEENVDRFLPVIDGMIESGLVTMEKVRAVFYQRKKA